MSFDIFDHETIQPFSYIGLKSSFWDLNIDILFATWLGMALLVALAFLGRYCLKNNFTRITLAYETIIGLLLKLCKDSFGRVEYNYFALISALFFFTAFGCIVGVIPYFHEATGDINTAFALGLTSFLYVQYQKIRVHHIRGYLAEFTEPFIALAPIHIIGELAKIASMSFRLFGNVLGDSVILGMIIALIEQAQKEFLIFFLCAVILLCISKTAYVRTKLPYVGTVAHGAMNILFIVSWTQLILCIVTGIVQSFVITMLTVTYLAMGTAPSLESEHKEHS